MIVTKRQSISKQIHKEVDFSALKCDNCQYDIPL